jgi:hypothetical protein
VIRRFKIEELVAQDLSGVLFKAWDTETGTHVAVRRFFPFGNDGGGFSDQEQTAYQIALARLAEVKHPSLCPVILGGCDPVDGIPFIVSEWIEAESLLSRLSFQPSNPTETARIIALVLELSERLSSVLAEDGIWVETELDSIVTRAENGSQNFIFRVSPLNWLGHGSEARNLDSVILLTEQLMGWEGEIVDDQEGKGLGGWLNWLRGTSATTSPHEAREKLTALPQMQAPKPTTKPIAKPITRPGRHTRLPRTKKKRSVNGTLVTIILLTLVAAGLAGWAIRMDSGELKFSGGLAALAAVAKTKNAPSPPQAPAGQQDMEEIAAMLANSNDASNTRQPNFSALTFSAEDSKIADREGQYVSVEGVFKKIDYSEKKNLMYLHFSEEPTKNATRGIIKMADASADLSESSLAPLIGKKIRIYGKLKIRTLGELNRPEITIKNRANIEVIE